MVRAGNGDLRHSWLASTAISRRFATIDDTMTITAARYIQLTARVDPGEDDEGGFVVTCPELAIASQGETIDEALKNIQEAIAVFLEGLQALGDLQRYLVDRGLTTSDTVPSQPTSLEVAKGEVVSTMVASLGARVAFA